MAAITNCIEAHPTPRTIQLGGVYVSIRAIGRLTGVDHAYLSRMLSGKRDPARMSLGLAMQIAGALGLSLDDFIQALYDRQKKLVETRVKLEMFRDYLDTQEERERMRRLRQGLPAPPSVPLVFIE